MSLGPYFRDQIFGLPSNLQELFTATPNPISPSNIFWWPQDKGSSIKIEKDNLQINVDVHFAQDEITVKRSKGYIEVECKHEEKQDEHGFISKHFVGRFNIPEDTSETIEYRLSDDGVFYVLASRGDTTKGERNVPITLTGPVRQEV